MGNKTDEGITLGPKPNWRQVAQEYISAKQARLGTETPNASSNESACKTNSAPTSKTELAKKIRETKKPVEAIPIATKYKKPAKPSRAKSSIPPAQLTLVPQKIETAVCLPPPPPSFAIPYQQRVENYRYDILIEIKNLPVIISTKNLLSKKTIKPGIYHARVDDDKWLVLKPEGESINDEYGLHVRQWAQYQRGHEELAAVDIRGEK